MTEADWLGGTQVYTLVEFLRSKHRVARTRAGRRRLRLFACACLRQVWDLLEEEDRQHVEGLERVCLGLDPETRLSELTQAATRRLHTVMFLGGTQVHLCSAVCSALATIGYPSQHVVMAAHTAAVARFPGLDETNASGGERLRIFTEEVNRQRQFLHDIFGNPFRPLPRRTFPADVRHIARALADGDTVAYPVLADALDELDEVQAAEHCRQSRHVRGCHVLDWVLGIP